MTAMGWERKELENERSNRNNPKTLGSELFKLLSAKT